MILRNRIEFLEKTVTELKKLITELKKKSDGKDHGPMGDQDTGISDIQFNQLFQDFN